DTDAVFGTLTVDGSSGGSGWTPLGLPGQTVFPVPDAVLVRGANARVPLEHPGLSLGIGQSLPVQGSGYFEADAPVAVRRPALVAGGGRLQSTGTLTGAGAVTVNGGTFLGGRVVAPALTVVNGGVLTSPDATASRVYKLDLEIADTLLVD